VRIVYHSSFFITTLFLVLITSSCNECENCDTYDKELYVNLEFYRFKDQTPARVVISEINQLNATNITYFQDTASIYLLPLSMNADLSSVAFMYSPASDYSELFNDTLLISYERSFSVSEKNYVDMIGSFTEVLDFSFDSVSVVCTDTLGVCYSNETIIKVYF